MFADSIEIPLPAVSEQTRAASRDRDHVLEHHHEEKPVHKIPDVTVTHKDTDCDLYAGRYDDGGGVALQLVERATGEPWSRATVNLPGDRDRLGPDEVFVKDYPENEGMMLALVLAGVVLDTGRRVKTGYAEAKVAKLLIEIPNQEKP